MNETRHQIDMQLLRKYKSDVVFLLGLTPGGSEYDEILKKAESERDERNKYTDKLQELCPEFTEGDWDDEEESFEKFMDRIAYKIHKLGTKIWLEKLGKEDCENLINTIHSVGRCMVTLENGDCFNEWELARDWEEAHGERLRRKGDWELW